MILDRFDEEWQEYRCSDCDPDNADPNDPGDVATREAKPYVLLVPMGEEVPDYCPRCGSYLSLCNGADHLQIANTPAKRWAKARKG